MTSTTNGREIQRLRTAKATARERFAGQLKLLSQITRTTAELDDVNARWHIQLAALARISGTTQAAAELCGLPHAAITRAVRQADRDAVVAAASAAWPTLKPGSHQGLETAS